MNKRAAALVALLVGCTHQANDGGQIFPSTGALDRQVQVVVTSESAALPAAANLDLGAGITVSGARLIDPQTLTATLQIDAGAELGKRDVTILGGPSPLLRAGAFEVIPAVDVQPPPQLAQGSVIDLELTNRDATPFDAADFAVDGPGLESVDRLMVTGDRASLLALVDPTAPPGPIQLRAGNFAPGGATTSYLSAPAALTVAAAAPAALALNATLAMQPLTGVGDSKLYKLTVPAGKVEILDVTVSGSAAAPALAEAWLFPASGRHQELLDLLQPAFGPQSAAATTEYPLVTDAAPVDNFLVVYAPYGQAGITQNFDVTVSAVDATAIAEAGVGPNQHAARLTAEALNGGATDLAKFPAVVKGSFAVAGETDVYALSLPAGKSVGFDFALVSDVEAEAATLGKTGSTVDFSTAAAIASRDNDGRIRRMSVSDTQAVTWFIAVASLPGGTAGNYAFSLRVHSD